jgi:hypothetical protein
MEDIFERIAKEQRVSAERVKADIDEAIKQAWNAPIGSKEKEAQLRMFPNGKMPAREEFIRKMSKRVKGVNKK